MSDDKISLIIPGVPSEKTPDAGLPQYLNIRPTSAYDIVAVRRGESQPEARVEALPDSIARIEYTSGLVEYLRVDQLQTELGASRAGGPVQVPAYFDRGATPGRGVTDWTLKTLHIFGVSPVDRLAEESADLVVQHFDSKIDAGLFRLGPDGTFRERIDKLLPAISKPYLIFIHGTASSTQGSFSGFWNDPQTKRATPEWDKLVETYGDRVLALEHATFSVSPARNALDLALLLPPQAVLHVISHSRGGLVGELLGLGNLDEDSLRVFTGRPDRDLLVELSQELSIKQFQVLKFVRTACPAGGTLLAGRRLDIWLNIVLNTIGLIPGLAENPFYEIFKATAIELIKLRADPAQIPGIEAQMPESPLIHLLNTRGRYSDSDLGVIAGDFEGAGVWGTLASWALRAFYFEDNDFVVNTQSMSAGMDRPRPVRRFLDQGSTVNHFSYFRNLRTRAKVVEWLAAAPEAPVAGFDKVRSAVSPLTGVRGNQERPIAIVVPDVFATHLIRENGTAVWPNYSELARGAFLELAAPGLKPGPIHEVYQALLSRLGSDHETTAFAYDWRDSIADSAKRLGDHVKAANTPNADGKSRAVRFVAHGMGGLVVREYASQMGPDAWNGLTGNGGGLVMLGSPFRGSWNIARILAGEARLVHMLALLGSHSDSEVAGVLRGFRGLTDLLPQEMLGLGSWNNVRTGRPSPEALAASAAWRKQLSAAVIPGGRTNLVLGSVSATPSSMDDYSLEGDGDVTWALSALAGVNTWYNPDAAHGYLIAKPDPIVQLLTAGTTAAYDAAPHPRSGTIDRERLRARETAVYFPGDEDLVEAALVRPRKEAGESESLVLVRVTHGHLRDARHPVAVGHYVGDNIVSAESDLDRQLDGRLSSRYYMEIYPGPVGTTEVVRAEGCHPSGAIVIGLGDVGEVTADKVRRGVLESCLRYALIHAEEPKPGEVARPRSAAISSLLIGASGGRAISIADSVNAIVLGAIEANRVLGRRAMLNKVRVDEIEFVEVYEEPAIEAVHAAAQLGETLRNSLQPGERVKFDCRLRSLPSGLSRRINRHYETGWWRRIRIAASPVPPVQSKTQDEQARRPPVQKLVFENLTDRARAEESFVSSQLSLIETLLEEVTAQNAWDSDAAVTLFELLLPNELKDQSREAANLVLAIDSAAARYPWELMAERTRDTVSPLATRMGVLRQLKVDTFRSGPRGARDHNALVIGDSVSDLPPLPGAQTEARAVAEMLEGFGYETTTLIRQSPSTIVRKLFTRDYRILHLAGHGHYDPEHPARSGMVLGLREGDRDNDVFLSPLELHQIRNLPELVFINCCHLGQIDRPLSFPAHRLAASVAEELIKMGVKAVIAAGWAVNDAAAATFAKSFYRTLLAGAKFGEAVKQARLDTYSLGNNNTWGAYQCYGDPGFALTLTPGEDGDKTREFCSRRECIDELKDVAASSQGVRGEGIAPLRDRLHTASRALGTYWRDGESLYLLADAHKHMSDFELAIAMYKQAIGQEKASAPIAAIEQLANVLDRYAERLYPSDSAKAAELWDEAYRKLEDLNLLLGESQERLSLLGGLFKRRRGSDPATQQEYYTEAARYYTRAYLYSRDKLSEINLYSGLNAIALAWVAGKPSEIAAECFREARSRTDASDFWDRVYTPDSLLLEHLIEGDLNNKYVDEVVAAYRRAFEHATPVNIDSALSQLRFLRDKGPAELHELLDAIVKKLEEAG